MYGKIGICPRQYIKKSSFHKSNTAIKRSLQLWTYHEIWNRNCKNTVRYDITIHNRKFLSCYSAKRRNTKVIAIKLITTYYGAKHYIEIGPELLFFFLVSYDGER